MGATPTRPVSRIRLAGMLRKVARRVLRRRRAASPHSLDAIGMAAGIERSSAGSNVLGLYEQALRDLSLREIVVIADQEPVETAEVFAAFYRDAHVTLLVEAGSGLTEPAGSGVTVVQAATVQEMHDAISRGRQPQLIIEAMARPGFDKAAALRELFLHLSPGGVYATEHLGAGLPEAGLTEDGTAVEDIWSLLARMLDYRRWPSGRVKRWHEPPDYLLAMGMGSATVHGSVAFLTRRGRYFAKVREAELEASVTGRSGADRFRRLQTIGPQTFTSTSRLVTNNPAMEAKLLRSTQNVPELVIRAYDRVTCLPRQVTVVDDLMLSTSFHQPWMLPLRSRGVVNVGQFARPLRRRKAIHVPGTFFHLDNEWAGHYGHFTTQDIAKLWAWRTARAEYPDIRVLISPHDGSEDLAGFQYEVLEAFGVGRSEIEVFTQPIVVDRLVTATQALQNPLFVHPVMLDVWREIRDGLMSRASMTDVPEKVFISRGAQFGRRCTNAEEVEAYFVEHGFTCVLPEELSLPDQAKLFANARVTAGYAGSAMLNLVYAGVPGVRIIIGSESYTSVNEYLISALRGDDIHYYWCTPEIPHPPGTWSGEAFHSDFAFDFVKDGPSLDAVLKSL